jgi:hypothetical protein
LMQLNTPRWGKESASLAVGVTAMV